MFLAPSQPASVRRRVSSRLFVFAAALLVASAHAAVCRAQAIGAHRGDTAGSGGTRSIQGRIYSPTGELPPARIRVTLDSSNSGTRTAIADADGTFNFNGLAAGPYSITVDAGREFEPGRESVYIEGAKPIYNIQILLRLKPGAHPAFAGVPKPALDRYEQAQEAARKGDSKTAVEHLTAAVAAHPQFALALSELGTHQMRLGQIDKAVESLRAAVKLTPGDFNARLNLGLALMEKKEYGDAEKQFREALKKNDKSAPVHMWLGVAVMRQRQLEEAERELQQAVKLGGDSAAQAHFYLGGIYWAKQDFKRAADELETYLKLRPNAPDAERTRATVKELRAKQK